MSGRVGPARAAGFTLVELLVALMLFGLIAAVATALTAGATRSFAATETTLAGLTDLEVTRAALAADLGQAARRPSLAPDGRAMAAFTLTPDGFVLVRRGQPGMLPAIAKVAWGVADGKLMRQTFAAVDGAPPGPATVMVAGVRGVRLRVAGSDGWQTDWAPAQAELLPRALEMTLERADGVRVTMAFLVAA